MKRLILVILALCAVCSQVRAQTPDTRFQGGILAAAGVPSNGTNCVETLTFGGTITGGTFSLSFLGMTTAPITWSATNATLLANINAAFTALPTIGTSGIAAAAGTLTAGVGTVTAAAGGNLSVTVLPAITVASNALNGTSPTLTVAITTPGVQADGRKSAKGTLCIDQTNGNLWQNHGVPLAPAWVKVSSE